MKYLLNCDPEYGCGKDYPGDMSRCPHCDLSHEFAFTAPINPLDYGFDVETYPNIFTCCIIHIATDTRWAFEISDRVNQILAFCDFLQQLINICARMVGFNNCEFDYPIIHYIFTNRWVTHNEIYNRQVAMFASRDNGTWLDYQVWPDQRLIEQIDLYKIKHFDNKHTRLKDIEFAVRMENIEDLPYPPGTMLIGKMKDELHAYNAHDVIATIFFYVRLLAEIAFREVLTARYNRDFMNHNDTKIGKDFFIMELEKAGIPCFEKRGGKKHPIQTIRPSIKLADVVFPYVKFDNPEFNRVLTYFKSKTITQTKGVFKGLSAHVAGVEYVFGTGGIHASIASTIVQSDDDYQIVDVDVASFYPNLAIKNKLFPQHLGETFCDIYLDVYLQRLGFAKGTPENAMLKLALNGVYGDSNQKNSPFYDSFYTMLITINGQLLLCMLVEQLIKIPRLTMIQANTDGVTFKCPREYMENQRAVCKWWEAYTLLTLEEALYSRMFIGNVNSYIAEYTDGKLKRIKDYEYKLDWHKDFSSLVIAKAAEAALVRGEDIRTFIENHDDDFDFMIRKKSRRSDRFVMRWLDVPDVELDLPGVLRYYITRDGGTLTTIAPPTGTYGTWKRKSKISDEYYDEVMASLAVTAGIADYMDVSDHLELDVDGVPHDERIHTKNKSKHELREIGVSVGWLVTDCNDVTNFDRSLINYDYYVAEVEKLVAPLLLGSK